MRNSNTRVLFSLAGQGTKGIFYIIKKYFVGRSQASKIPHIPGGLSLGHLLYNRQICVCHATLVITCVAFTHIHTWYGTWSTWNLFHKILLLGLWHLWRLEIQSRHLLRSPWRDILLRYSNAIFYRTDASSGEYLMKEMASLPLQCTL